jgi:putative PIN family toxin of toxin-antitoxin system
MRIVLDANIVIAAFASRGLCESILELCLSEHEVILCGDLINEIEKNLRSKIKVPPEIIAGIKEFLIENSTVMKPASIPPNTCRDPDDDKILGLAVAASAEFIITVDKDLLVLEDFEKIQIVTPRMFSEIVHRAKK